MNENKNTPKIEVSENMTARKELAKRIQRLTFYYTEEYVKEIDNKKREDAAIKEMQENPSNEMRCIVLTAENNAEIMLDCVTDLIHAVRILTNPKEDVEDWMLTGIGATLDKVNEMKVIPFDLPICINGMLAAQYR